MAVREIILLGNPVLRIKSKNVNKITETVRQTISDLDDTLQDFRKKHGFGRGISAPQIGVSDRIIFLNIGKSLVLINPRIVGRSRETMRLWDDCFSFPDLMVKVKRYKKIRVNYFDERMRKRASDFIGDHSELVQHEIDHLDGVLAIDRAIDTKHIILRSEWEKGMALTRSEYIL